VIELGSIRSKDVMTKAISRMIDLMQADERITSAIQNQSFSLTADLTDLDSRYYFAFRSGQVSGGEGDDPDGSSFGLEMTSKVFDDLFSGGEDAMGLAMSGKIAFTGDVNVGMLLMGVLTDVQQAYNEAKAGVA